MNDARAAGALAARPAGVGWVSWALLALGVLSASISAILTRYASAEHLGDAQPLAIAFWRCALGALALAPFAAARLRSVPARRTGSAAIAGVFLAVHFATWLTSLDLTTIAHSVLLVSISPVFVALAARFILGERLRSLGWVGMVLALVGTAAITGGPGGDASALGDLLAFVGGVTAGGYVFAGQLARRHLGILEYAVITYTLAAVPILAVCLARGIPLGGYGAPTWLAIAAILVGPQLLGHTILNLVVKDIGATVVSVAIMAEPPIAVVAAFLLFGEVPSAIVYPAGAVILTGIYLVSRARMVGPVVTD
ncbi:MAG: DMT family transporter [Actinomycetota bacterium]